MFGIEIIGETSVSNNRVESEKAFVDFGRMLVNYYSCNYIVCRVFVRRAYFIYRVNTTKINNTEIDSRSGVARRGGGGLRGSKSEILRR